MGSNPIHMMPNITIPRVSATRDSKKREEITISDLLVDGLENFLTNEPMTYYKKPESFFVGSPI